jgi:hypothetical protein
MTIDGSDALTIPLVLLQQLLPLLATEANGALLFRASVCHDAKRGPTRAHHRLWPFSPMAVPVVVARLVESRVPTRLRLKEGLSPLHAILFALSSCCIALLAITQHGLCPSLSLHVHTPPHSLLTNPSSLPCPLPVTHIPPAHLSPWRTRRQLTMASKSLSQLAGTS